MGGREDHTGGRWPFHGMRAQVTAQPDILPRKPQLPPTPGNGAAPSSERLGNLPRANQLQHWGWGLHKWDSHSWELLASKQSPWRLVLGGPLWVSCPRLPEDPQGHPRARGWSGWDIYAATSPSPHYSVHAGMCTAEW